MSKNSFFVILCSLFCIVSSAFCAELSIELDKTVVNEGDVVYLTINYTGEENGAPDLSNLTNDFKVVSNSISQSFNIINGNISRIKSWTIGLIPYSKGKKVIKPIKFAKLTSNYAELEVKEITNVAYVPDSRENSNSPYFQIEQVIDNTSPFVQQQTNLSVKIYDSIGLPQGSLNLDEASKKDWLIMPLSDKPNVEQKTINGKNMNVITFSYAIFPQKSGNITLPSFAFDGYYTKNSQIQFPPLANDFSFFGMDFNDVLGQRVPVKMKTEEKDVQVLPAPQVPQGVQWLPLTNLEMTASWQPNTKFYAGEALSRSIKITATGGTHDMLPNIKFTDIPNMRQYPETPQTDTQIIKNQIISTSEINNVYIPQKEGTYVIPPISLTWFNVNTKKFETTTIPSETIEIKRNPILLNEEEDINTTDVVQNKSEDLPLQEDIKESSNSLVFDFNEYKNYIFYFLIFLCALFIFYKFRKIFRKEKNIYTRLVVKAIKNHHYPEAKKALLDWAKCKYHSQAINNFNDIIALANNSDFKDELMKLNKMIYANDDDFFDTTFFITVFKKVDKSKITDYKDNVVIPNLYS